MRIANRIAPFVVLLALAAPCLVYGAAPWTLDIENDTPKHIALAGKEGHTHYWYLVFRVKNPGAEPRQMQLAFTLELQLAKDVSTYGDVYAPIAERRVEDDRVERPLANRHDLRREPLAPGKEIEGIVFFRVGERPPDFDKMTIHVRGLVETRTLGREDATSNVRKFRHRDLLLRYNFVPSRWSSGKELKYVSEDWTLVTVDAADRESSADDAAAEVSERIKALREKIEAQKNKLPPRDTKAPGKTSAAPLGSGIPVGKANPALVAGLRAKADAHKSVRAAYTEVLGQKNRAQTAGGAILLGSDGAFSIERVLNVGTGRSLKERRVYDGKSLWSHIATREMGDIVKRWKADATKKEWRTAPGRTDVSFATIVNPFSAWRVFGDDLAHMGIEKLDTGLAYVFEVKPGDTYRALLDGPLSGELLGKALGRRVRFWVDAKTGIQLRMRIYDDAHQVVGSIECLDYELNAHTDRAHYSYSPPSGVKVIEMTSALADGSATTPAP